MAWRANIVGDGFSGIFYWQPEKNASERRKKFKNGMARAAEVQIKLSFALKEVERLELELVEAKAADEAEAKAKKDVMEKRARDKAQLIAEEEARRQAEEDLATRKVELTAEEQALAEEERIAAEKRAIAEKHAVLPTGWIPRIIRVQNVLDADSGGTIDYEANPNPTTHLKS